ncbi:hypothetical protein GCG54_00008296 [Colletotrichum gloeosporioides]|uniref:SUR7 protein n=1 Tax=Colletotrichum gloeosporioides TaxID=474922 RepID=A0A8H4C7G0_COLGL|nr:uncharacterized protein GCG54_00008296 [Colletotrichum gloeosporioides]KAF3798838.1 hypothetical protein GCG54_00008296 [Colletotrichum gloeosporioides]
MARNSPTGKVPAFTFLPILASMIVAMLIVVIIASGSRPGVGDKLSFLRVDATNLNIPAKLGGSQYLQDLSRVSGADLVGQDATPATLQIFDVYYVTLLGSCGHVNDVTVCTTRLVGYWFDPRSDLKLDATSIAGSFSSNLNDALNKYAKTSSFFGVAYIFAFVLAILAPIVSVISGRCGRAGFAGVVLSAMATICLLAASIATTVIFKNVNDAINEDFNDIGISSALGLLFVPTWIALSFSLLASVLMGIKTRNPRAPKGPTSGMITGRRDIKNGNVQGGVPRPLTLLKRVQTWGQHKYVHIGGGGGGQFANPRGGDGEFDDDTALIGRRYSPELDSKQEQESSSIAMVPLDHKGSKDMNQAYESYTGRAL